MALHRLLRAPAGTILEKNHPRASRDQLIEKASLFSLRDYLRETDKIGVFFNADEIILISEDIQFLSATFGSRATVFPRGGHLGNLRHRDYVVRMLSFFGVGAEKG